MRESGKRRRGEKWGDEGGRRERQRERERCITETGERGGGREGEGSGLGGTTM